MTEQELETGVYVDLGAKKVRVAIIGIGRMGLHHARAIEATRVASLVAVADPFAQPEALRQVLSADVRVFTDAVKMLIETKPDVVHVVTPPHTHAAMAMLALEHGAHVYVEKPFTPDAASARAILTLARQRGLSVCAGHQVLFQDSGRKYREFLPRIGKLVHAESYFSFKTVRRSPRGGFFSPVEQLVDILPHPTYLLLSAFEPQQPESVVPIGELVSVEVDARGEIRALLKKGDTFASLVVTLRGRPVESYLRIVGDNGSIRADFVISGVSQFVGPGVSAISALLKPFSEARQILFGTIGNVFRMLTRKHKSYAGLAELAELFYRSISEKRPSPVSPESIIETVSICEEIGKRLAMADIASEERAKRELETAEHRLAPPDDTRGVVLVTGGTGFLGRVFVEELRGRGWRVRAITRRIPPSAERVPGVEYVQGNIADDLQDRVFGDVSVIAHLAAETAGGKEDHERNSIQATRKVLEAAARGGIRQFVHVSSIAVLKPRRRFGAPLREDSPVDAGNLGRGPYVWGKAESEILVSQFCSRHGIGYRTVRLGPLVDFRHYAPPGRLGREVGPLYVAVGGRRDPLSVCDVTTAACVLRHCVEQFDSVPTLINLVEAPAPSRGALVQRLREARPDLRVVWLPNAMLLLTSWALKGVLRLMHPSSKPLDLHAAFASERYDSRLAAELIATANRAPVPHNKGVVGAETIRDRSLGAR